MKHRISASTKHTRIQIAALAFLCLLGVSLTPTRAGADAARVVKSVSYTHLTLPTICSV